MLPLISILILSSLDPIKNFVSLKTYISQNAQREKEIEILGHRKREKYDAHSLSMLNPSYRQESPSPQWYPL